MRVLVLATPPAQTHGWSVYARDLCAALAERGIAIHLMTAVNAPATATLAVASYHRVLPSLVPPPRLSSLRTLAARQVVARTAEAVGADVVHVMAEPYTLAAPPALPLVVTAHGTYLPQTAQRRLFGLLYRRAYRRAEVVCVSRYTERFVQAALPGLRTTTVFNGVDAARFQQQGQAPTKRGPTVLAVGKLKPRKGFHVLAAALRQVRQAVPAVQAVFLGDTSDKDYYDELSTQLARDGLTDSVHVLGRVSEDALVGWYHAADVFALPALNIGDRFEGFGLVYLEASAAGLPTVGTLDCGAEDAIRDGETGLLVPQNDPSALAAALIRLLQDGELRARMGDAGQRLAQSRSWAAAAEQVEALYRRALGSARSKT
jgi:phosphatidylinositol alpha-1,6-mannosyltransferase